ncbi:hypothetical protein CSA17_02110 [bacterium DOLJORAL78_65_58]|nr:MAG: hypothetical protein CSB20_05565 [bacterium DOLZORAL124_64_63]PIE76454.1 MAG: hypothetical protein CSA17_02110 [bacterium DOLJORAL78_65_58]
MSQDRDTTIALFLDFDNVALGARDARQRFDVKLLMQRLLEKGKILVKKAYADWHYYKEHMQPLHESAIELIEIPMPRISGKNSADIKLVVDAMELCYTNEHIDTFVIVSGDSDFSPLVSKLRENNKRVVGVGVKNSSSHLLINNCDEFLFYDNIYRDAKGQNARPVANVPADKREMFEFLVGTVRSLLQESRGVLYSSLIKDTMTRKMPDFNERSYGYSTFGDMLDDARRLGLLVVERDARAGGTWVVQGLGDGKPLDEENSGGRTSSSRRRRRSGGRKRGGEADSAEKESKAADTADVSDGKAEETAPVPDTSQASAPEEKGRQRQSSAEGRTEPTEASRSGREESGPESSEKKASTKKAGTKKTTKKTSTKKTSTKKAPTKKTVTKKTAKKASVKKTSTKKTVAKKTTTKKATTKKTTAKKTSTKKTSTRKATTKKAGTRKTTKKAATKKAPANKAAEKKTTSRKDAGGTDTP